MPKIFISYRRADSRKDAGRLYDRLAQAFGHDNVFKDVDDIPFGSDFRGVIAEAVSGCDVLLALIGRQWVSVKNEDGQRRLDNSGDFVRIEIETGLQRDQCTVIPVLVDSAPMPGSSDLPDSLRELAYKNAIIVRDDPDFHRDVDRLISDLKRQFDEIVSSSRTAEPLHPSSDIHEAISQFYAYCDDQKWNDARRLLAQIRETGRAPRFFNFDEVETEIWEKIEQAELDNEYAILRLMAEREPAIRVWTALQVFWESYPDYDPERIADRVKPAPEGTPSPDPLPVNGEGESRKQPGSGGEVMTTADVAWIPKPDPPRVQRIEDILPPPFEWCEIPAGEVTLISKRGWTPNYIPQGESKSYSVNAFCISKYPITNAQYKLFIEADGYEMREWWTDAGWDQCVKENWIEPRYWQDETWNEDKQPVVGVSWYEAVAFCQWLSAVRGERIMLPTEQQWQRAAQGDDGRAYPWGDEWDGARCNNSVPPCESRQTTPVRQFEKLGDSPFGVVDMVGNIGEWCLTGYKSGNVDLNIKDARVLRGGTWGYNDLKNLCVTNRNATVLTNRSSNYGLRIVCASPE